jgi:hypothetical protein
MNSLTGPDPAGPCRLGIGGFAEAGTVTVMVKKEGYAINSAMISTQVHYLTALATGGTVTYKPMETDPLPIWEIHTFTGSGTFEFPNGVPGLPADVLVVGGGGGTGGAIYPSAGPARTAKASQAVIVLLLAKNQQIQEAF